MDYCNKSREELAEDVAKLRKRIEELESSSVTAVQRKSLDRHIDSFRLWQDTFNVVDDMMYIIDREFKVIRANKPTCDNLETQDPIGKKCFQLFHGSDNPTSYCPACKVFHSGKSFQLEKQEKLFGNKWYSISAYPIKDDTGFVWQCLLIYKDITDCKKMMSKLNELEVKDQLTGLINRRHFMEVVGREFRLAARRGGGLVLLLLNVDRFMEVNNSCGRKFGDYLLKEISDLLVEKVRYTDICSRLGGDEFAILLPDADYAEGQMVANNIHSLISQFVFDDGNYNRQISISIGLAANSEQYLKNHEDFFTLADKALNQAKKRGGDRVVVPGDDSVYSNNIEMIANY